ncbi:ABC transporter substrate-binding protein [Actinomadura algeriensis]|uniref:NitT/TauT family transport system substrate-binding protein n=1 Tax=Actinomadura algeriensis TaxID=1679523 RepID=A0ABR9K3X8_9ACTN|nr:ABC transporter substrate-binding protein [Actinomadura algeriensis]MBE1537550.1 NitT/TauT family transport system substrate-binding protein [Actinomadura algeriensis]
MPVTHRRAVLAGALAIAVGLTGAACSSGDEPSANGLETSRLTLGTMTVADTAPVQIAVEKGLFEAEGLEVRLQTVQGGAEAIPKLKSGALDISFGNFVSLVTASVKDPGFKPEIVAEGFLSGPKTHTLMVRKDSPYHSIEDLEGKKIGVNTKKNISTLMVEAAGKPKGVTFAEDDFVEIPPPNMEQALKSESVEAVQAIEPFGTQMQQSLGARMIADLSSGPTAEFPIAGYASTEKFVKENPKTVAAFQRALQKAAEQCRDRKVVQDVLPTYAKIDAQVASTMSYGSYPTTLDPARLQKVPDLMREFGYIDEKVDVKTLIAQAS